MPLQIAFTNTYLRPPGGALVGAPGTGNWTILAWVKPPPIFGTYTRTIWYLNNGHALRMTAGQQLQFVYGVGSDNISALSPNTWYCTAVTKQGTTAARYYLNGAFLSQRTASLSNDDTAAATIGAWNGAQDWLFATMSVVKVWDAVLTDAEIAVESAVLRPVRTDNLRAWHRFLGNSVSELEGDFSGGGRHLTRVGSVAYTPSHPEPPVGYGAPVLSVGSYVTPEVTVFVGAAAELGASAGDVTIDGGVTLSAPLVELAFDGGHDGRYTHVIPRTDIRAVSGGSGFKGGRAYLSDAAKCKLELVNTDGRYTDGGGLWMGMWCKVRLAGSGELLFTGRVTELTPGYGVSRPYLAVTLDTSRNDLTIPAQSVLLKDTNTRAAALALLDGVDMTSGAGFFIFDHSLFDGVDVLAPTGAEQAQTYGSQWMSLAAAGGYGKSDGEMDVLDAVAELMKAEDGRAVWNADNVLALYSRQWLDDARDGEPVYTLTDDELVSADFSVGSEYVNDLTLTWTPSRWEAGASVYTYEPDTPDSIKPGEYRDYSVRFRAGESDRIVAAENPSVVITQTGPTVSSVWQGGIKATGGTLRVACPAGGAAAGITKIAITARALVQSDLAEERRKDNFGVTVYGARPLVIDAPLIDTPAQAVSRAQREFAARNERASFARRVTLKPRTRAAAAQWMTLPFATPLRVQSARLGHNARYLAIGADWKIGEGGVPVDVTLTLEPNVTNGLFTFDSDEKGWDAGRLA